jgi:hypothetical protein
MLLIHGAYHFGRRRVGARNDFCNACERVALAELWRSFDCLHLFWIPLVPIGSRERWLCTLCKQDPRKNYTTRKGFKIAGLLVVALLLFCTFFTGDLDPKEKSGIWIMQVVLGLGFAGLLYSVLKKPPPLSVDERRARVVPLSMETCSYCHGPLRYQPQLHCPKCQIQVFNEPRTPPAPEYGPLVQRIREQAGEVFWPASEADLATLRRFGLPEPIIAFYGRFAPKTVIENGQTVRLHPIEMIVDDNTKGLGSFSAPHGYVKFASTFTGDGYCFDLNSVSSTGDPRVAILSHESVCGETTAAEMQKLAKAVAPDFRTFLERFIKGELDEEALDYDEAGL